MNCLVAVTLRHNVRLDGDVALARREFAALARVRSVRDLRSWHEFADTPFAALPPAVLQRVESCARTGSPIGFMAMTSPDVVGQIVRRAAFLQEVAVRTEIEPNQLDVPPNLVKRHGESTYLAVAANALCEFASYFADEPNASLGPRLDALLAYLLSGDCEQHQHDARAAVLSKKTTLSLTHDLHIYKAKFFPRMIRALLNLHHERGLVIDPFSGSGTALLEAASLGIPSHGVDVDPLSALISECKVTPFTTERTRTRQLLWGVRQELEVRGGGLPLFTRRSVDEIPCRNILSNELRQKLMRRDAKDGTRFLSEIEEDLDLLGAVRAAHSSASPGILQVLMSDAVTKKIRYRFVGVGNGRYTIEVVHQRIAERFARKVSSCLALCDVFEWLESKCGIRFATARASRGSATSLATMEWSDAPAMCITSPPYLPASSGREHYASARQLAMSLTGLDAAWLAGEREFVGVADANTRASFDPTQLTPAGRDLLRYLLSDGDRTDPQRDPMRFERKAVPTWRYLLDVEGFLRSLRSVTAPGSKCLLVVASQHIFYSHKRKQEAKEAYADQDDCIEYVAPCGALYGELAERAGWSVTEEIRMELAKSATSMARPRSTDDYSESVLVLERIKTRSTTRGRAVRAPAGPVQVVGR